MLINKKGLPFHIIIDEINPGLVCPILSIPIISDCSLVIFKIQSNFEIPNRNKLTNRIGFFAKFQDDHSLL